MLRQMSSISTSLGCLRKVEGGTKSAAKLMATYFYYKCVYLDDSSDPKTDSMLSEALSSTNVSYSAFGTSIHVSNELRFDTCRSGDRSTFTFSFGK